ncbi:MAG: glycoside hydrolase family 3 C-terminal domain-containing protein [Lachnospiraceae bacterium]|nr:glycoside hydrolase family 3 C-terminal domain-containing protein [Lachnospiraceae bacterium]
MKKYRKRVFVGQLTNEVTERETKHRAIARKAAAEGFVLLKNDGVLPYAKGSKVGLYGAGSVKTIKGGTGSGDVNERDCVNVLQGLLNAGYDVTSKAWCESFEKQYDAKREAWRDIIWKETDEGKHFFEAFSSHAFKAPAGDPLDVEAAKNDGADLGIFVLSRVAGEGADRKPEKGDYYITDEELAILKQVSESYKDVLLVVNSGGLVDLGFVDEIKNINAIIQFVQAGQEGGNALADVISGDVTPSGKMTDTWPNKYEDYPSAKTFSHMNGDLTKEEYLDGIYVGYRYFDTFDVPVKYAFGFGLSYTDFAITAKGISVSGKGTKNPTVTVEVEVKNTGAKFSGKEVVQIYASAPQKKLAKEFRRLTAFAKTKTLAPGEAQTLKVTFPVYGLASFDESRASYVLEGGEYVIWVGNSLCSAEVVGSVALDADATMVELEHICERKQPLTEIAPDAAKVNAKYDDAVKKAAGKLTASINASDIVKETVKYQTLTDELPGEAGEIVNKMSLDQLIALSTGEPSMGQGSVVGAAGQTVPGAAAETTLAAEDLGVASIVLSDGPAGLRLNRKYNVKDEKVVRQDFMDSLEGGFFSRTKEADGDRTYYQYCTAIPVGTLLAQTFNAELIKEVGEMIGQEMNLFETTLWLAPGMNIHRNPLCGRNFEYYSEDPVVSGIIAAAMTIGVQRVGGCGTTIKHYATNNSEDNRMGVDSIINERALREIYLKGFEICIKDSQPMSIMTSYNQINGVHAANCYDTCTKAARDEWGFAGAIMTDWGTTNHSTAGVSTASGCLKAGNDMTMPGTPSDHEDIRKALDDGTLDIREMKRCVRNTVNIILQSNQYENPDSYLDQFEGLDSYITVE